MSNARRRAEIERIRDEGAQAAHEGRHRQTNPYKTSYPDWLQWARGYSQQKVLDEEAERAHTTPSQF